MRSMNLELLEGHGIFHHCSDSGALGLHHILPIFPPTSAGENLYEQQQQNYKILWSNNNCSVFF